MLNKITFLDFCLPEVGDIVTLPMKSVSLVVAYSSMLFLKLFHSPALPGAPSIAYRLSVDWHHSKRCVYLKTISHHKDERLIMILWNSTVGGSIVFTEKQFLLYRLF